MVAPTSACDDDRSPDGKPRAMIQSVSVQKILRSVLSSNDGTAIVLKWRVRRGVVWLRPPSGGPMAARNSSPSVRRNDTSSFLWLYHPEWSSHWRISSMGGCAPYFSRCGKLASSMKQMKCLPAGAPYTCERRLSSFEKTDAWSWFADVCAEKVMMMPWNFSGRSLMITLVSDAVFPVPVGPVAATWQPCTIKCMSIASERIESTVGTSTWLYGSLVLSAKALRVSSHGTHDGSISSSGFAEKWYE
mmetsp:Transcript_47099/g.145246  ORF Transcript_47099/g.145246 Transcript_47099/m.145246 type:complete len:246 (-) Transcript_47099:111-848(-)